MAVREPRTRHDASSLLMFSLAAKAPRDSAPRLRYALVSSETRCTLYAEKQGFRMGCEDDGRWFKISLVAWR